MVYETIEMLCLMFVLTSLFFTSQSLGPMDRTFLLYKNGKSIGPTDIYQQNVQFRKKKLGPMERQYLLYKNAKSIGPR